MNTIWKSDAYAKINLGLHVLNRLENGYHEIETGFVFIEWIDEIRMQIAKKTQINYGNPLLDNTQDTLIHKAIESLKKRGFTLPELKIDVKKRIPMGAGLGGGSSDAATTLRMINHIAELGIKPEELATIGATLGADVPIFLKGETCFASGTGTQLKSVKIQPDAWIVTVYPNFESSTSEAYQNCLPESDRDYSLFDVLKSQELDEWQYLLENDLEKSVIPFNPIIGDFKDQMYDFGAMYSAMSGSGSSVFGLFEQDFVALAAYEAFLSLNYPVSITKPQFKPDFTIYSLI
jgi:4-diphosphocytidyl-2-C-methyl-D-erythritol kinase